MDRSRKSCKSGSLLDNHRPIRYRECSSPSFSTSEPPMLRNFHRSLARDKQISYSSEIYTSIHHCFSKGSLHSRASCKLDILEGKKTDLQDLDLPWVMFNSLPIARLQTLPLTLGGIPCHHISRTFREEHLVKKTKKKQSE